MLAQGVILDTRSIKSGVILGTTKFHISWILLLRVLKWSEWGKNCDLRLLKLYKDFGGVVLDTPTFHATYLFVTVKFC